MCADVSRGHMRIMALPTRLIVLAAIASTVDALPARVGFFGVKSFDNQHAIQAKAKEQPAAPAPAAAEAAPAPAADAEAVARQGEASLEQVEADMKRMATFGAEVCAIAFQRTTRTHTLTPAAFFPGPFWQVRRSLDESDKAARDVSQALSYFRRQTALQQDERDTGASKVSNLENEVAQLQRRIQALEADKKALLADKATLGEANRKVLAQLSQMAAYGQAVQTGLAFQGLALSNTTAS